MWDIKMRKLLTPILLVLVMSGCSSMGVKPLEIFTTEVEREKLNLPLPPVETMEKVRIIVVTSKNQEEVFAKLVKDNIDPAYYRIHRRRLGTGTKEFTTFTSTNN